MKDKCVIRYQHSQIGALKFYPASTHDAKRKIQGENAHLFGETVSPAKNVASAYPASSSAVTHSQNFKVTSPITQDTM